jgi:hypothetical protein
MIKEMMLLSVIYGFASLYNMNVYPYIITIIDLFYYHNIIISFLILIQIDNFTLFYDLSKKIDIENNNTKVEDKYLKIILNQIDYINKKEKDIERKKLKFKETYNKRNNRSCNDIYNLC